MSMSGLMMFARAPSFAKGSGHSGSSASPALARPVDLCALIAEHTRAVQAGPRSGEVVEAPSPPPAAGAQPQGQPTRPQAACHPTCSCSCSASSTSSSARIRVDSLRRAAAAAAAKLLQPRSSVLALGVGLPASMQRSSWSLSDYRVVRKLSQTATSKVYQALCKVSAQPVVLKVYDMEALPLLSCHHVYREVRIHAALQHPNIINLYAAFKEGRRVVLVQELAEGGDLHSYFGKYHSLINERRAVELVRPLLQALAYLHEAGVMHRDVKLENVLLTKDRVVKLADFGLAISAREERPVTRAGTTEYMAPEVLACPHKVQPQENKARAALEYGPSADVWAVGVLTYELVARASPFAGETSRDTELNILRPSLPKLPTGMSESCQTFITQALSRLPSERPSVAELLASAWVQSHPPKSGAKSFTRRSESSGTGAELVSAFRLASARSLPLALLRQK